MAEVVLFNIADEILGKLGKLVFQEVGLICSAKEELEKLKNSVSAIKAVLLDAEERQARSHQVRDWLGKLKDAIYDVDDLLDEISTRGSCRKILLQQQQQEEKKKKKTEKVRVLFSKLDCFVGTHGVKMCREIKKIRERLDEIAADKNKYHFRERTVEMGIDDGMEKREQTHSFVCKEEVIGREDDKNAVVELLLNCDDDVQESSSSSSVSVIPIVGIGGLGKTTLAQLVYNDERIKKRFEKRMWVCVSNVFDTKIIVQKILESATQVKYDNFEMESLQAVLRKEIDGRRFLLILDDVWNENRERWLKLRNLLTSSGSRGSKIIVTTRTQLVAAITGTIPAYNLKGLPRDESWSLFKKMAFKQGQEPDNSSLIALGKEIVKKCAGVPLAIRSIGSLLYSKKTESEWLYFKNTELSQITQDTNDILLILKLSFEQLPSYLRQCFAYCSLFPKDYEIDKQTLVNLWIAQGFVQSSNSIQTLEEIGDRYVMELLGRCFFQDVEYDQWGNVLSFKMHDLIHDLAQSVAGSESSLVDSDARNVSERIRHLSLSYRLDSSWKIPRPLFEAKRIRTFLLPMQPIYHRELKKVPHDEIVSNFRSLRALDLHNTGVDTVSNSIGKLKLLRYLDLSKNKGIVRLPSLITRLQNLRTLKLNSCKRLEKLPRNMRKMTSLRHLEIDQCIGLTHMPCGIGQLTSLQTLTRFVVGKDCSSSRRIGSLRELKDLNNLTGELTIVKLGNLKKGSSEESKEANLKGKQQLGVLRLEWEREVNDHQVIAEDEVLLENLQPHSNLKELHVYGYRGGRFPHWILSDLSLLLPNLREIIIWRCYRCLQLPLFSQLPMLKVLQLEEVTAVEYIENHSVHNFSSSSSSRNNTARGEGPPAAFFPSLKQLRLFDLRNLKGWWREVTDATRENNDEETAASVAEKQPPQQDWLLPSFPHLSKLVIGHCPKLASLPLHECLEELELKNVSAKLVQTSLMIAAETEESSSRTSASPLSRLKLLSIDSVMDLVSLPEEGLRNLCSLENLYILNCPKLLSLAGEELRGLTSLRFLSISGCGSLMSLSQGLRYLTTLEELEIEECRELDLSNNEEADDGMQLQGLKCLRSLKLVDMPKLECLPDGLQHATTLQTLQITRCSGLKSLPDWIGKLTTLQRLEISDCPELKSLPQTMCCLESLQSIKISKCPQLLRANQKNEASEDWPKIAHIPDIRVDGRKM
ncbi:hypothetical protein ACOSQ2_009472 [Xanthoceras sorbifolium]